jgi:hypothetical protein
MRTIRLAEFRKNRPISVPKTAFIVYNFRAVLERPIHNLKS